MLFYFQAKPLLYGCVVSQITNFAGAMVLSGNIDSLIDFFSFTAWIFYGGSMVALLLMRRTRPNHPRPYKCPLVIPVLVLLISAYLIVAPIIDKPQIEYLYAAGFIAAGMLVYLPFVKFGYVPKFMGGYIYRYTAKIKTDLINLTNNYGISYHYIIVI